jgi:hypothetical protein
VADNARATLVDPLVARLKPPHGPQTTSSYKVLPTQCQPPAFSLPPPAASRRP